ncbi:hypothetical protein [Maritimibacter fusiformis]|uniref:Serine active site containing 1-like protein n=1 Tax=Maritimibacter fusiformis TaxID=2603819 RepID=A0A5D0RIW6_9RHOB|nr:hypothetical protein [Maritimibacter fusiformis]TYB80444.1 hypothetical protein FVF75_12420 [Maritimibacter fusiformis]
MSRQLKLTWGLSILAALIATLALLTLRPFIDGIQFAPDQGFNWYFWKRPDPDTLSRASVWGAYVLHQVFIWGVIAWAKTNRDRLRDRNRMHPINWIALGGTAFFVGLHYLQTAVFYDGLGQDLPVITSQGSVILLLVIVLIMEAPRRGLFFGTGKSWFAGIKPILIRYHGYYFAWAITFTYWYHPMELTGGHLLGFFYTFLLFLQAAFVFTRVHSNRWWTFTLEASVLIHGVVVALVAGQEFWTMFFFGFLFLVVVTQMHGLKLPRAALWGIAGLSVAAMLAVYSQKGWGAMNEVVRIPAIEYGLAIAIGGAILAGRWLVRRRTASA